MAEPRGLVCEGDLQGMEVVAAELEHLGRAHGGDMELARQVTEQFAQLADRIEMAGTDDREGRPVIVTDRRTFAQELRLEAQVKTLAVPFSRFALDDRSKHVFDRTGNEAWNKTRRWGLGLVADRGAQILGQNAAPRIGPGCRWPPRASPRRSTRSRLSPTAAATSEVTDTLPLAAVTAISSIIPLRPRASCPHE